jgi:uncharacterized protein GlcG (DUF336 family)
MTKSMRQPLVAALLAAMFLPGTISAQTAPDPDAGLAPNTESLTADDVKAVIAKAAGAVDDSAMVIAVSDRQGNILAVFRKNDAPLLSIGNFSQLVDTNELAAAVARTAAFFSNSQAPLSSRTVRFISGIHFPPGIMYTSNGALYGIENTNRGCSFNATYIPGQEFPASLTLDGSQLGLGIITGKKDLTDSDPAAVNPGGVPLYKNGRMVGGVGVAGVSSAEAEYAAFVGSRDAGFLPLPPPDPGAVFIGGIALPFVDQTTQPDGTQPVAGGANLDDTALASLGQFIVAPFDSPGPAPEGDLVAPKDGVLGGLTADEVRGIIDQSVALADKTRANIRLPLGTRAKFVIAVADLDGQIVGLHRMKDATVFSIDVSVAKARNVIYFSGPNRTPTDLLGVPRNTAVTNRTIGYGAQPLYPPGIDFTEPGPFFSLYQFDATHPCTQGAQPANPYQNGIVFFPGALPLYRNGVLVGGLGVSGDGVDQDDFVTNGGAANFQAPTRIRADRVMDEGVRLPYLKFPRNPTD